MHCYNCADALLEWVLSKCIVTNCGDVLGEWVLSECTVTECGDARSKHT